ncbi:MAG: hypothetical protein SGI73_08080 [Chloroflexota bacterium]|nr:hypothetical protein [Chloroflexota bacterium]
MAGDVQTQFRRLKAQVETKIQGLLTEFAEGKISREQFQVIYARYDSQLLAAEKGLDADQVSNGMDTIHIRAVHMGKAMGLVIYHHRSGRLIDTLGTFDVKSSRMASVLNDFSQLMESRKLIDRKIERAGDQAWLFFAAGKHTTIITLFQNEPSSQQMREIERLHHDFEVANDASLSDTHVDVMKLAYPFHVFIQQKLKRA